MFMRVLAAMAVVTTGALALEVVFGVRLGIQSWMLQLFSSGHPGALPL